MDLRVKKTRHSIVNAFMELRAFKPLEKITVKELCEKAEINKSTFYSHFKDVYDLSDQLESEIIEQIIEHVAHPDYIIKHPQEFIQELFMAFQSQSARIEKVFAGNQEGHLAMKLNLSLKKLIYQYYPEYQDDPFFNVFFNYAILGGYYAMRDCREEDKKETIHAIGRITEISSRVLFES